MKVLPTTAYCMNLDSRTDRWAQVSKDFERLRAVMDINIERVSAIENTTQPQNGLTETFKSIIKLAKSRQLPYVLILEDDLFVADPQKVIECLNNAPEEWDILLGGVYYYVPNKEHDENWMLMKDFCSLHFIVISETIYDKILGLNTKGQHLDRVLGGLTRFGGLRTYLMHPMPCQQRAGFSNLRKRAVNDNATRKLPWSDHPDVLKN